jgi:nucleotide-binding universal stress UspA family protein
MQNEFRILVAVDFKADTRRLLVEVERFSRALNALVNLVHVAEPNPDFVGYLKIHPNRNPTQEDLIRQDRAEALQSEHEQLHAIAENLKTRGIRVEQALMVQGPVMETILEHTSKLASDLLIVGAHHHNALYRFWYGDTAAEAARRTFCSLLVVPPGD